MRICTERKSKIKYFLLAAILFTITIIYLIPTTPTHRPKTRLIFNNEYLCASNHGSHLSPTKTKINNQTSIVIVVLSHRNNFMNRHLIRSTWGSVKSINNIKILAVVFMLASSDAPGEGETDRVQLETERLQFGDMVMGEFMETYRNLTRKTIMAYEWLTSFCREAQFVVKTDDDVLVNIFKLTENLSAWPPTEVTSSHLWCAVHWNEPVIKEAGSPYRVYPEQYAGDVFPKHCAGVGYVTPMGVIDRIIDEISRSFPGMVCTHEDVFMTGIIPEKINSMNSSQNEPITHVDKIIDWVTYALQDEQSDNGAFLSELLQPSVNNETKTVDEFRKRFGTQIFYLISHGPKFAERYQQLWEIVIKKI